MRMMPGLPSNGGRGRRMKRAGLTRLRFLVAVDIAVPFSEELPRAGVLLAPPAHFCFRPICLSLLTAPPDSSMAHGPRPFSGACGTAELSKNCFTEDTYNIDQLLY